MLNVFLTFDIELWCDGWSDLDKAFPTAFRKYIYGPQNAALPYTLKVLNDYGLHGVFYVEPLFAARFGVQPLSEIVGLILEAGQEVQLHLHTEWADEADPPIFSADKGKRQHLFYHDLDEQRMLIAKGKALLRQAGVESVRSFRAGSFGANRHTLTALADNGLDCDSSYDNVMWPKHPLSPDARLQQVAKLGDIYEYPMSVFEDGFGRPRHAQIGACSFKEMRSALWQAVDKDWHSFVILSHNFECLNRQLTRKDPVVRKRYESLCRHLAGHSDVFHCSQFNAIEHRAADVEVAGIKSPATATAVRYSEQLLRKFLQ